VLCGARLLWRERKGPSIGFDVFLGALALGFVPGLLFPVLSKIDIPRRITSAELLAIAILAALTVLLRSRPALRVGALGTAAVVGLVLPLALVGKPPEPWVVRSWRLNSQLYPLKVTEFRGLIRHSESSGGAIAPIRDRYLVANGAGDIYVVSDAPGKHALSARRLPYRVPMNLAEFTAAVGHEVDVSSFRTADLLAQEIGGNLRLFASHHYWKAAQRCFVVRVSMLQGNADALLKGTLAGASWKTVFETHPCLRIDMPGRLPHFGGIQIGGRLALLSPHELLLTVGDEELDGVNAPESAPQDPASSYGKTISIDLDDFSSQLFSMGHRNPEGLYVDTTGTIWLTEHGPQGGDELNLLERGANYGWPLDTYGTQYGERFWPEDPVPGSHEQFRRPYYAWVPSIGVSNLLVVHGSQFPLWQTDLLVSSLRDGAIYRTRIRDSRVVMMERIPFGRRIRDIAEAADGRLLLWTDKEELLTVAIDKEVGSGETLFQACAGCHMIGDGTANGIGPDLRHIVDRVAASIPQARYSSAMRALGGVWTRSRLDEFLKNPQAFVPGTSMQFAGMADAGKRAELIEFLASGLNNYPPPEE